MRYTRSSIATGRMFICVLNKRKKGKLKESPSPKRVVGHLGGGGGASKLYTFIIRDSSKKLKHQKRERQQNYEQNRYENQKSLLIAAKP